MGVRKFSEQANRAKLTPEQQALVLGCRGLVYDLSHRFARSVAASRTAISVPELVEDLAPAGMLGLVVAAQRFDPEISRMNRRARRASSTAAVPPRAKVSAAWQRRSSSR